MKLVTLKQSKNLSTFSTKLAVSLASSLKVNQRPFATVSLSTFINNKIELSKLILLIKIYVVSHNSSSKISLSIDITIIILFTIIMI